jgi:hypothetical protein
MVLSEAIKRLRDSEGKKVVILWRGLKNMNLEHDSDFLLAGGVEMSPMSTSYLLKTARDDALPTPLLRRCLIQGLYSTNNPSSPPRPFP